MIKRFLPQLIISISLWSCETKVSENKKSCFPPELIVEFNKDTFNLGEKFIGKLYLSDPAYYSTIEPTQGKTITIHPIMKINDRELELQNDTAKFQFTIALDSIDKEQSNGKVVEKDFKASIQFPNAKSGDVIIQKIITYNIDLRNE